MGDLNPEHRSDMLEWLMGIGSPTAPTDYYVSFHIADPVGDPITAAANEITKITRTQHSSWNLTAADSGIVENTGAGESAAATGGSTEDITHFSVWDSLSGGKFIFGGTCTNITIADGDTISWADGALTVTNN